MKARRLWWIGGVLGVGLLGYHLAAPPGPAQRAEAAATEATPLPQDPFRRCATKALRGDYGPLQEWQRVGYQRGLEKGATPLPVWVTTYYPEEGFARGEATASGYGCSERVAAANLLPRWCFVWLPSVGLRQVLDCGARANDRVAQRRGAACWVDLWEPRRGMLFGDDNGGVQTAWVISRRR